MLDKGAAFIKACKPEETVLVYHVGCGDGMSAATVIARAFLKHFGKLPKEIIPASPGHLDEITIPKFAKYVVFVDMVVEQNLGTILDLKKRAEVAVFDHHETTKNLNSEGIIHIHPEFFQKKLKGAQYSGAKLSYDICSKVTDLSDSDWIAAAGLINDVCGKYWKSFFDGVYEKYPALKKGKDLYGFESNIGKLLTVVGAAKDVKDLEKEVIQAYIKAKNPEEILQGKGDWAKFQKFAEARNKEIDYFVKNWQKLAEIKGKLVFYELKSKLDLTSAVATILSLQNPELTFVVLIKQDRVKISFRNHSAKVDCNILAKELTNGIGTGGGHPPAAGATIDAKYFAEFKKRLLAKF